MFIDGVNSGIESILAQSESAIQCLHELMLLQQPLVRCLK
jgi:hypothetical protein